MYIQQINVHVSKNVASNSKSELGVKQNKGSLLATIIRNNLKLHYFVLIDT